MGTGPLAPGAVSPPTGTTRGSGDRSSRHGVLAHVPERLPDPAGEREATTKAVLPCPAAVSAQFARSSGSVRIELPSSALDRPGQLWRDRSQGHSTLPGATHGVRGPSGGFAPASPFFAWMLLPVLIATAGAWEPASA